MKICPNCGKELADDVVFCEKCGYSLEAGEQNKGGSQGGAQDMTTSQLQPQMQPNFNQNNQSFNQYASQYAVYDPKDHTAEYDSRDISDNKVFAALAYFGIGGLIIALLVHNSPFARFHARNGAALMICEFICLLVFIIPVLGWAIGIIILLVLEVVGIIGFINALKGKAIELPLVSDVGFIK